MQKYYFYMLLMGLFAFIYGCKVKPVETLEVCQSIGAAEILNLKSSYDAGDKIKFSVRTKDLHQEDLLIIWDSKVGERYYNKTVYKEDFIFSFPDSISNYSGQVVIKVVHCKKILATQQFYINSLYPVGTIESYLGPKTLAIDQNMESMLCLIPVDKYGNAMEESDTVSFNTKYSGMPQINVRKGIKNLLSFVKIENNQQVGKVLLGAKCEDSYIDEQEIAIIQGPMKDAKINIVEFHPYSDQRQVAHLNTDVIYDFKGNIVADGTSVLFVVYENDEIVAQYHGYTVSGIANAYIENPKYATTWKVLMSGAAQSSAIELQYHDNIESIPLRIDKDFLIVGPVVGSLDQYVPDGTLVKVDFNYIIKKELEIEHGFAKFKIPDSILKSNEIICEVEINSQKVKLIY